MFHHVEKSWKQKNGLLNLIILSFKGKKKVIKIRNCSLYSWPEKPTACNGFPLCCQDENRYHTSLDETQTTE